MTSMNSLRWSCRDKILMLDRTLIMGVLNVTPDSFSDGGRFRNEGEAVERGLQMAGEGADLIDVGGESTRPGAEPVPLVEELRRVVPVVRALARQTRALISVDTMKSRVAEEALTAGAHIINDISALSRDPAMAAVCAAHRSGVILMHMQGTPATMQAAPRYEDVVREVTDYLRLRLSCAAEAGIPRENLSVDPGIGFGKTVEHNVQLLAGLGAVAGLGRPVVIGVSRKSFLGRLTGRETADRLPASLGALAFALLRGARVARVHDVKETCDVVRLVDTLRGEEMRNVSDGRHTHPAVQRGA